MRRFKLDISRKTGETTLWMATEQTTCGYTPIIGWSDISGLREFIEMLLDMYRHNIRESERVKLTSDNILQQVFYKNEFNKGDDNE